MAPEEGRSAIAAAARAVADMRLGRVDAETTANVGVIAGGTAANIVPERCAIVVEARSHDDRKLADIVQTIQDAVSFAAGVAECEVETSLSRSYRGYRFRKDDRAVRLAVEALESVGVTPSFALSGGAADANVFNERGLRCLNLTHGVHDFHSPDERIEVADLEAMVGVTVALVEAARA
jgi:tripeptide aminopeptidase